MKNFLPTTKSEMKTRGWDELDFILVSGDAYVDHPSFGTAIISRYLRAVVIELGFCLNLAGRMLVISPA